MNPVRSRIRRIMKEEHWLMLKNVWHYAKKYYFRKCYRHYRRFANALRGHELPKSLTDPSASFLDTPHIPGGSQNMQTMHFINTTNCRMIAEIGVYTGSTSKSIAEYLN